MSLVVIGLLASTVVNCAANKTINGASGVFYSRGDSIWHLANGSKKPLKLAQGTCPAVSPDSKRVAFCKPANAKNDSTDIFILDIGTGKKSRIMRSPGNALGLCWSPRSDILAFACWTDGQDQLRVVNTDGSSLRILVGGKQSGNRGVFSPQWSVDGQSIYSHDIFTLFQVDLSGKQVSKKALSEITGKKSSITSADCFVPCPTDSNLLAFTQSVPGTKFAQQAFNGEPNTALFTYNTATKVRKRLTPIDLLATDPVWSKDGKSIYFCGYRDRSYKEQYPFRIYKISATGTGLTELVKGESPSR
jgi:Tol biopolymer transport system component